MEETKKSLKSLLQGLSGATNPEKRFVSAIVLAAGMGSRMQNEQGITKQMMPLLSRPVIAHTLQVFFDCLFVDEVIVVGRENELPAYETMAEEYGWRDQKPMKCVVGGETRQDSALCGFKAIDDRSELVLIHDGARCLVTEEILDRVSRSALTHGAAIAAERVTSTVKQAGKDGLVAQTLDRNEIWLAQTPQAFRTEVYRAAVYLNLKNGAKAVTDDAMLVEQIDLPVKLVDCGGDNLKITTPRDLRIAAVILAEREEEKRRDAEEAARDASDRAKDRETRRRKREF